MATVFTEFSNVLPDPVFPVTDAGSLASSGTGSPGPGFASVQVRSVRNTQVSRTISGRGVTADSEMHTWEIEIGYNPMTRDTFDSVDSFLESRNGRRDPFFVVLPQKSKPKDPLFATFALSNVITVNEATLAGTSRLMVKAAADIIGVAKPGDMFTFSDPENVNHLKVYKVVRVETANLVQAGTVVPTAKQMRLHISPPLTRNVSSSTTLNFIKPKFRVILKDDVLEHQLNTDGMYSFQLSLEEILP